MLKERVLLYLFDRTFKEEKYKHGSEGVVRGSVPLAPVRQRSSHRAHTLCGTWCIKKRNGVPFYVRRSFSLFT